MERRRIVVHESVCDSGSREERLVILAAERHPVMTSDQISAEESAW
jgi:hypothetical protein